MSEQKLERIMLVEDDPDIQTVGKMALETVGGFTVSVCSSGMEALEKVEEFNPDFILMDVMMPELDGPSTLREFRKIPSVAEVPVVFMTAKAMPQEIEEYKKIGALDVISKPFDPMTLSDRVREIWGTGKN